MTYSTNCQTRTNLGLMKEEFFSMYDQAGTNDIEELKTKVSELEHELNKQRKLFEQRARMMQLIWGDNFNSDSLH